MNVIYSRLWKKIVGFKVFITITVFGNFVKKNSINRFFVDYKFILIEY